MADIRQYFISINPDEASTAASTHTDEVVGGAGASRNDKKQQTSKEYSEFSSADHVQQAAATTADDPISSAAHPASTPTSAMDTPAQTPISTVRTSAQTPVIHTAQLANTNLMPMRPELPCDNARQWKLLQILMTKPLPDVKSLKSVMTKWSGYKVHLYGVRAMLHYYPETVGTFFSTTLPFIIKCALQLKTLVAAAEQSPSGPIRFLTRIRLQANVDIPKSQQLFVSRDLCRSLLANMLLCTITSNGGRHFNYWTMIALLESTDKHDVAKLRMMVHYFERTQQYLSMPGQLRIYRQVTTRSAQAWAQSDKPLLPVEVVPNMVGFEDARYGSKCLHADFANKRIGGGVLRGGCVQEEIRFAICPELCVTCLFCEVMRTNEAIQVIGAEQFSSYKGYSFSFRYTGDFVDKSLRDHDGTVWNGIAAIDALDGRMSRNFSTGKQLKQAYMLREINKAFAGFCPADESVSNAFPVLATGNWGCGVFMGDPELKFFFQYLAACEGGIKMRYFPFDEGYELGPRIAECAKRLVKRKMTVGTLFRALLDISNKVWAPDAKYSGGRDKVCNNLRRGWLLEYVVEVAMGEHKGESDTTENGETSEVDEDNDINDSGFTTEIKDISPIDEIKDISPNDAVKAENLAGGDGAGDDAVVDGAGDNTVGNEVCAESAGEEVSAYTTKRSHADASASAEAASKRMKM